MKTSYWLENQQLPTFPTLQENITCEICIVGAGLQGIALAYLLQGKKDVVLVDQDAFMQASSSFNTGKLTAQHDDVYHKLQQKYGLEVAKTYFQHNQMALEQVQTWHKEMSFDLLDCQTSLYAKHNIKTLQKEYQTYQKLDIPCLWKQQEDCATLTMKNQYQFHPVQLAQELLKRLHTIRCYSHTQIIGYNKQEMISLKTHNGYTITAQQVIFCNHSVTMYPSLLLFSRYEAYSSYILMKSFEWNQPFSMIGIDQPSLSFRTLLDHDKKYILLCNEDHRFGIFAKDAFFHLQETTKDLSTIIHRQWQNHDYMTFDHLPFIGEIEKDVYLSFGFNMWGNSWSIAASLLLKDALLHQNKKAMYHYRPQRVTDILTINFLKTNSLTAWYWLKYYFLFYYQKPNGTTITFQNKKYGYCKQANQTILVDLHCPHMGCILQYNPLHQSWDCPCHASSFQLDGTKICGPTTKSLAHIIIQK